MMQRLEQCIENNPGIEADGCVLVRKGDDHHQHHYQNYCKGKEAWRNALAIMCCCITCVAVTVSLTDSPITHRAADG